MEGEQPEIDQRAGDRRAVEPEVLLVQVPAAGRTSSVAAWSFSVYCRPSELS